MFLTDAFVWDIYAFSLKLRAKPFKIDEDFEVGKTVLELLQKRQDGSHKARSQMDGISSRHCYCGERFAERSLSEKYEEYPSFKQARMHQMASGYVVGKDRSSRQGDC